MDVVNHFCPNCGCRIVSIAEAFPGMGAYPVGIFEKSTEFILKQKSLQIISYLGCKTMGV